MHWSHTKPLTEQSANSTESASEAVRLTEGEFNEAESHASFMEALNEWRSSAGPGQTQIEVVDDGEVQVHGSTTEEPAGGNLWVNPAFAEPTSAPSPGSEEKPETEVVAAGSTEAVGGQLLNGSFDEEKEHRQFQLAVEAWRKGKHGPPTAHSTSADSDITKQDDLEMQSCWYSYELFAKDTGHFDKDTQHWFKDEANCKKFKQDQEKQEAERAKRKKQLEELLREQEEEAERAQTATGDFELEYDTDEETSAAHDEINLPTTVPIIEEVESASFDGHWEADAATQYTVEEVEELQDMDVKY